MPRSSTIINSFNAGELSPRMTGRTDFSKYANGCETLENFVIFPQGGATRRPGTYYVAGVKDHNKKVRLVKFEFSTTQAYILEFGDQYLRFYMDNGQITSGGSPYEIATPYLEADLFDLKFAQSADILYIVHRDYAPRKLSRTAHITWTLGEISFLPYPTSEQDVFPAGTLTPAATTGTAVTFTVSSAYFQSGDVDRQIISGSARAVITAVASGGAKTTCTARILDAFPSTSPIASGSWSLRGSPTGSVTPDKAEPVNGIVTLTSTLESFRAADVGKYMRIHNGFIVLVGYTSTTVVSGQILSALEDTTATGSWTLESQDWSATLGYPEAVCFYEGRLFFSRDDTLWGSVVENYEDFTPGDDDDLSVKATFLANEVNTVKWLEHSRTLMAGSVGGEWSISSAAPPEPITPKSIKARRETTYGCAGVMPLKIAGSVLFVQRAGQKLRELTYRWENDAFVAPDLMLLSDHIAEGGIVDLAYQQEPYSIVWAVRGDGVLLGMTYDRSQDVVGWHRHPTDGLVESVAVIPGDRESDELWISVQRTIDGETKRYIEYLMPFDWGPDQEDCFFVDCGLTYDGTAVTSVSGLGHLEGKTVSILADGATHPDKTVVSGAITLDRSATVIHVGLPYTATLKTHRLDAGSAMGTAQGKKKRIHEIRSRFYQTLGGQIGGSADKLETVYYRKSSHSMDGPPPLFSGDKVVANPQGWNLEGQVMIVQAAPLPMTILAVMAEVTTSDE